MGVLSMCPSTVHRINVFNRITVYLLFFLINIMEPETAIRIIIIIISCVSSYVFMLYQNTHALCSSYIFVSSYFLICIYFTSINSFKCLTLFMLCISFLRFLIWKKNKSLYLELDQITKKHLLSSKRISLKTRCFDI